MAVIITGSVWQAEKVDFLGSAYSGTATQFAEQPQVNPGYFYYGLNDVFGTIKLRPVFVTQSWVTRGEGEAHFVAGTGLTVDDDLNLTGGTAQVLVSFPLDTPAAGLQIYGVSLSVQRLAAVSATVGGEDDTALLARMLQGNDLVGLSDRADVFASFGGADLVFSNGGTDTLRLGEGMDCGITGAGDDTAYGADGDDLLCGNQGRDLLIGADGLDIIDGGKGADRLRGGQDADTFVFLPGDGHDRIFDFNAAEDVLSFGVPGGLIADVVLVTDGRDAVVTYQDNVIRLIGGAGLSLADIDIRFGFHVSESRLESFVDLFDFKA